MAKYYSGIEGKLSVDGVAIGRVASWNFSSEIEPLDATTLGDVSRKYRVGRQASSGSCTFFYYAAADGQIEARPLLSALIRTGRVPVDQTYRLKLASSDRSVEFDAVITSVQTGASAGGVMQASVEFVANGPLLEASLGGN